MMSDFIFTDWKCEYVATKALSLKPAGGRNNGNTEIQCRLGDGSIQTIYSKVSGDELRNFLKNESQVVVLIVKGPRGAGSFAFSKLFLAPAVETGRGVVVRLAGDTGHALALNLGGSEKEDIVRFSFTGLEHPWKRPGMKVEDLFRMREEIEFGYVSAARTHTHDATVQHYAVWVRPRHPPQGPKPLPRRPQPRSRVPQISPQPQVLHIPPAPNHIVPFGCPPPPAPFVSVCSPEAVHAVEVANQQNPEGLLTCAITRTHERRRTPPMLPDRETANSLGPTDDRDQSETPLKDHSKPVTTTSGPVQSASAPQNHSQSVTTQPSANGPPPTLQFNELPLQAGVLCNVGKFQAQIYCKDLGLVPFEREATTMKAGNFSEGKWVEFRPKREVGNMYWLATCVTLYANAPGKPKRPLKYSRMGEGLFDIDNITAKVLLIQNQSSLLFSPILGRISLPMETVAKDDYDKLRPNRWVKVSSRIVWLDDEIPVYPGCNLVAEKVEFDHVPPPESDVEIAKTLATVGSIIDDETIDLISPDFDGPIRAPRKIFAGIDSEDFHSAVQQATIKGFFTWVEKSEDNSLTAIYAEPDRADGAEKDNAALEKRKSSLYDSGIEDVSSGDVKSPIAVNPHHSMSSSPDVSLSPIKPSGLDESAASLSQRGAAVAEEHCRDEIDLALDLPPRNQETLFHSHNASSDNIIPTDSNRPRRARWCPSAADEVDLYLARTVRGLGISQPQPLSATGAQAQRSSTLTVVTNRANHNLIYTEAGTNVAGQRDSQSPTKQVYDYGFSDDEEEESTAGQLAEAAGGVPHRHPTSTTTRDAGTLQEFESGPPVTLSSAQYSATLDLDKKQDQLPIYTQNQEVQTDRTVEEQIVSVVRNDPLLMQMVAKTDPNMLLKLKPNRFMLPFSPPGVWLTIEGSLGRSTVQVGGETSGNTSLSQSRHTPLLPQPTLPTPHPESRPQFIA